MKIVKKLLVVLGVIVVVLVVLMLLGLVYSGSLIKMGVETAGTQATGTSTTLASANLSVMKGELSLSGLKIANPAGYQTESLLNIGKCTTVVNVKSLMSDTIEVRLIQIENLDMTLEQNGLKSNLSEILDQIKKKEGGAEKGPTEKSPSAGEAKGGKKVKVNLIELKNPVVHMKLLPIPGKKDVADIKLGDIRLENVGQDSNQAEMLPAVFQKVLVALSEAVVKAGGDVLPADLQKGIAQSAEGAKQLISGVASKVTEQTGQLLKGSGKAVEDVKKGVGDVLKLPGQLAKPKDEKK